MIMRIYISKEITTHLDSKVANRLWISVATIKKKMVTGFYLT